MKFIFSNLFINLKNIFNTKYRSMQGIDCLSDIGQHTYIGKNCSITRASIGRYCSIANNVSIGPGEHEMNTISTSSIFYEDDVYNQLTVEDCKIGNDVWIGVDAIIRRGVTIGDGAIIGANSFVNQDIPNFAVAVGSPATVIKFRFSKKDQLLIRETKWWDYKPDIAKQKIKQLKTLITI